MEKNVQLSLKMICYRVALFSLIDNNPHLVSANSHILFTSEKTYCPRFESFQNVITKIKHAVLNKTRINLVPAIKYFQPLHFTFHNYGRQNGIDK